MKSLLVRPLRPALSAVLLALASAAFAQTDPAPAAPAAPERPSRRSFNPEDLRNRMLAALRQQFQVEDDAEWAVISERIGKVTELRRASLAGVASLAARATGRPGGDGLRARLGGASSPEAEALSDALKNQATDAELKARLDRLRESRKENEARLAQAQEELREVLNLRQEAVAVLSGLLP